MISNSSINASPSEFIDIGGRRLSLFRAGHGRPTVILECGLGSTANTWEYVQPAIAQFTTVCSYDRAGLGQSDMAPIPRTCQDMVNDLHTLVSRANLPPPYVLVGHSMGGLIVRLYAAQYPGYVVGLILVDASHEDKHNHFEAVLSENLQQRNWAYLKDPSRNAEYVDILASNAQVRSARQKFDFPLIVLARGQRDEPSPVWPTDDLQCIEVDLQRELVNFSIQGQFTLAVQSGHFIQRDEPELIIGAIRHVVELARQTSQP